MEKKSFMVFGVVLSVFALSKLSFAGSCGCGGGSGQSSCDESTPAAQAQQTPSFGDAAQVAVKEPVNVGNKICPVSGEKIAHGKMKPATYEHEGKIYNFCCAGCIDEFKSDPQRYIKKVEEELKAEAK